MVLYLELSKPLPTATGFINHLKRRIFFLMRSMGFWPESPALGVEKWISGFFWASGNLLGPPVPVYYVVIVIVYRTLAYPSIVLA